MVQPLRETGVAGVLETVAASGFVNRRLELEFLADLAKGADAASAFVVLRAPSGYGKSSLTSEFIARLETVDTIKAAVDPLIRLKSGDAKIYEGYFVQRCAGALSEAVPELSAIPRFGAFLKQRSWKNVREKDVYDAAREFPGPEQAYRVVVDYAERYFSFGKRDPKHVLKSDAGDAVAACRAYVELVCASARTVIVVREAQHMDHESMRVLLAAHRLRPGGLLIFEYTSEEGGFDPDHQKILERELAGHGNAHILDLVRLERGHFEQLLRRLPMGGADLSGDFYGRWDGNLRVLSELKYQVGLGRRIAGPADLAERVGDFTAQIEAHVGELPDRQRLLLALVAANVEPIARRTLFAAAASAEPETADADLASDLDALHTAHGFLDVRGEIVSLANEDLAAAIRSAPGGLGAMALAERALRDVYVHLIRERDFAHVSLAIAARLAFQLCARTGDVTLLTRLTSEIDEQMRVAHDQTPYVDVVTETVTAQTDLLPSERKRLIDWAGALAYEICDFAKARALYTALPERSVKDEVLLAHCHIEGGAHDDARAAAARIRERAASAEETIAADLIEAGVALDGGDWEEGRRLLNEIVAAGQGDDSPLVGHAYRLMAEMQEYPECTETAVESVSWFERLGLEKSRAYSALSASRFLARTGKFTEAVDLIDIAERCLRGHVRNEHLVLNNRALVGLLSDAPDYDRCAEWLRQALRSSRYDFGDLSILSNLALAHWKRGDLASAGGCVARCEKILAAPDFAERDVFWPICYNLGQVLDALDRRDDAAKMRALPRQTGWANRSNDAYWAYRYGETTTPDATLTYLLRFDYHPVALSHWNVDRDCLSRLT